MRLLFLIFPVAIVIDVLFDPLLGSLLFLFGLYCILLELESK